MNIPMTIGSAAAVWVTGGMTTCSDARIAGSPAQAV